MNNVQYMQATFIIIIIIIIKCTLCAYSYKH